MQKSERVQRTQSAASTVALAANSSIPATPRTATRKGPNRLDFLPPKLLNKMLVATRARR